MNVVKSLRILGLLLLLLSVAGFGYAMQAYLPTAYASDAVTDVVSEGLTRADNREEELLQLVYQPLEDDSVRLAWDVEIDETSGQNYWSIRVDAVNGELLDQVNWVINDEWGQAATESPLAEAGTDPYPAPEAPPSEPYPAPDGYPYPPPDTPYPAPYPPYPAPYPSPDGETPSQSFEIPLSAGWNLISVPLQPPENEITRVLSSISGHYEQVYAYDGCNKSQPWQKFDPNAPPFANTLNHADEKMGLWINMSVADTLVMTGTIPLTTTISSCSGWNLVGYPSLKESAIKDALDSIEGSYTLVNGYQASNSADPWQKFDANAPSFANTLNQMQPGKGYWIQVDEDVELVIKNP